jgi:hypothetical protein
MYLSVCHPRKKQPLSDEKALLRRSFIKNNSSIIYIMLNRTNGD